MINQIRFMHYLGVHQIDMTFKDLMKRLDEDPVLKEDYLTIFRTIAQDFAGGPVRRPALVENTLRRGGSSRANIERTLDEMIDLDLFDMKEMT